MAQQRRRHRGLIRFLLLGGSLVGVVAVLAVWINRQALNPDSFASTSSQMLANEQIRTALSSYLVAALFRSVDVSRQLRRELPAQLQADAGEIAELRQRARREAPRLLEKPQVQAELMQAVGEAHTTFLRIATERNDPVSTHAGVVTLDLHRLVGQLVASLGIGSQLAAVRSKPSRGAGPVRGSQSVSAGVPRSSARPRLVVTLAPSTGRLVIVRASQLKLAGDIVSAIKDLALTLPLIAIAMFALAMWLATGWRLATLRATGWCFVGIGVLVLLLRRFGGNALVENLVKASSDKPAAHQIWAIGTSLVHDIAVALISCGLIVGIAAWGAGTAGYVAARRRTPTPPSRRRTEPKFADARKTAR